MLSERVYASISLATVFALAPTWSWAAGSQRIDLTEFGRVVEMPDKPKRTITEADELVRGAEGWEAVKGDDGLYTIGVQWDEPRELAEVNIEFRHAIADREQIKVQYWKADPSDSKADGKTAKGEWLTPKSEWWAGDRDVSFSFLPGDKEGSGRKGADKPTRVTTRLRFVCGKDDLPPVRYLRAYGPGRATTDNFDLRFERNGQLAPPVMARTVNGYIMASDGKTKMTSAVLRDAENSLEICYAQADAPSPNRTQVILSPVEKPELETVIVPVDVAKRGQVQVAKSGVVVERRGGKRAEAGTSSAPGR